MDFVIVGNGVAGITAAFALREREPAASITVVSGESDYFFSRTALMYTFMDRMTARDLEPFERQVYRRKNMTLVRDWVADLDAHMKTLRLKSGSTLAYGRLLLATGSTPNQADWPGLERVQDGVANFVSWQDLEKCERLAASSQSAVVVGGGLIGVELVECLVFHGVRVTFLIREPWYWPVALGGEESAMVTEHLQRHGVDVRVGETIAEVMAGPGGRVSGIRTHSGQTIPCEFLGVCIGVRPSVGWLQNVETCPATKRGIVVGPGFETSLPDVWAAGDCAEVDNGVDPPFVEQLWYSAKEHGALAARSMLGDPVRYRPPVFYNSSKFFEIEFTTVGRVIGAPAGSTEIYRRLGPEASLRIVEHAGAVIGFNMLGSRWDHTYFERWIEERRPLAYVMGHLHEAQFDVEFGRVPLHG